MQTTAAEQTYQLDPGYAYATAEECRIMTVTGTSVAVSLYDQVKQLGGMCNFWYPKPKAGEKNTVCFGTAAIAALVRSLLDLGAKIASLEAQIFGGAGGEETGDSLNIGEENIQIARKMLDYYKIKVVSESVGGVKGKKIVFNSHTGEVLLYKSKKIRDGDWHPYKTRSK